MKIERHGHGIPHSRTSVVTLRIRNQSHVRFSPSISIYLIEGACAPTFGASNYLAEALCIMSFNHLLPTPLWDDERGSLSLCDRIVKQFDKPAQNQRAILREFQRLGWPAWIDNPIEQDLLMDDSQRLADAVYRRNRDQKPHRIQFRCDGRGRGITWELVKKKKR